MGLNVGTTNVDFKVDKGFMTIAPFTSVVNSGQLNFGGSADFKKTHAIFRTPGQMQIVKDVQLNKEMADKLLAKVNPIFLGASSSSGTDQSHRVRSRSTRRGRRTGRRASASRRG